MPSVNDNAEIDHYIKILQGFFLQGKTIVHEDFDIEHLYEEKAKRKGLTVHQLLFGCIESKYKYRKFGFIKEDNNVFKCNYLLHKTIWYSTVRYYGIGIHWFGLRNIRLTLGKLTIGFHFEK